MCNLQMCRVPLSAPEKPFVFSLLGHTFQTDRSDASPQQIHRPSALSYFPNPAPIPDFSKSQTCPIQQKDVPNLDSRLQSAVSRDSILRRISNSMPRDMIQKERPFCFFESHLPFPLPPCIRCLRSLFRRCSILYSYFCTQLLSDFISSCQDHQQ